VADILKIDGTLLFVDIMEGDVTAEEQGRIKDNKHELDRYLGVYPYERYNYKPLYVWNTV